MWAVGIMGVSEMKSYYFTSFLYFCVCSKIYITGIQVDQLFQNKSF